MEVWGDAEIDPDYDASTNAYDSGEDKAKLTNATKLADETDENIPRIERSS